MYSPRKFKSHKKHTPGWIVTFADVMALLLTFFIMMLSFSNTDSQKYKAVVESMEGAFGPASKSDMKGLMTKIKLMADAKKSDSKMPTAEVKRKNVENSANAPTEIETQEKQLNKYMGITKSLLAEELLQGAVQLDTAGSNIIIRFPERVAFTSGSEELTSNFASVINKLKKVLTNVPGLITISGHTDNRPIDTFRFRSNWELSSARAVSVLHAITNNSDLDIQRFTVQGHADTHPIKPNNSSSNQAENRRVEISIQSIAQ